MSSCTKICVTTGDIDGIGTEIAAKAFERIQPKPGVLFIFWRSPDCPDLHLRRIDSRFERITVASLKEALEVNPTSENQIVDIDSTLSPALWVELSAKACMTGDLDGLATGPISKTIIHASGMSDIGHTDILKRISNTNRVFMSFVGIHFNVVLATGHVPLNRVSGALNSETLTNAIEQAHRLKQSILNKDRSHKPICVVGINPHAGENGIIGSEELELFSGVLQECRRRGIPLEGPLVPDAAFLKKNWPAFSVYVCPYHDQGLIPFKLVHGQSGVHISMGLPFVRTSVDHGTAKDIFGRDVADASSMSDAIEMAIVLARARRLSI